MSSATVPAAAGEGANRPPTDTELRAIRADGVVSAVAGMVFAALLAVSMLLLHQAPGLGVPDSTYTQFYNGNNDVLVTVGLYIVPFAGIAFLWYMTTTRTFVAAYPEPPARIPFGLHLAAGVLFVALMFAGTAAVGAWMKISEQRTIM